MRPAWDDELSNCCSMPTSERPMRSAWDDGKRSRQGKRATDLEVSDTQTYTREKMHTRDTKKCTSAKMKWLGNESYTKLNTRETAQH